MSTATVVSEVRAGALWVRLNRPEALNSIDRNLLAGLESAMDDALASSEVHAMVITGSGRAFCAGADLAYVDGTGAADEAFTRFLADVGATFQRLERLPLPTIAAVNGFALAGGLEMVLCCDLVIAVEGAKLGDAHANYGLIPGGGGTVRLPRRVGPALAKQLMFTGAFLRAEDLRHSGLLNEVVTADLLEAVVDDFVALISAKSPLGLQRMKQLVDDALEQPIDAGLRTELTMSALHARSSDMSEGLAAFREKRAPVFTGH